MINALINGIAWAGIVLLFEFSMRENNILAWYWEWLDKKKYKFWRIFGTCKICFAFWFGLFYLNIDYTHYFIFLGISQMILIFFDILLLNMKK